MNQILEIDEENLTATVQPGVITLDMIKAVESKGLFYPPDPSSMKISTIGGNINENSGGLRGLKYGVTRDYVLDWRLCSQMVTSSAPAENSQRMWPDTISHVFLSAQKEHSAL